MNDASFVRLVQGERRLMQIHEHVVRLETFDSLEAPTEFLTTEQFHHEKRHGCFFIETRIGYIDDMFAFDACGNPRFLFEAGAQLITLDDVRVHHLERATPFGFRVDHFVNGTHPARCNTSDHPVSVGKDRPFFEPAECIHKSYLPLPCSTGQATIERHAQHFFTGSDDSAQRYGVRMAT